MSAADTLPNDDWTALREPAYTGPETGEQLAALGELERMAGRQASAATVTLPPYTGPRTGDQFGVLGLDERAALGRAAEAIGEVPGPRLAAARQRRKRRERGRARLRGGWPLGVVLLVQAVLSLRLVWSNTAFTDEALYLWAGRLEWAHLFHGTPIPPFATYFSGAPVVYPPIGAIAASVDGLAGARILSLVFMLAATGLLWGTGTRLFGGVAGFFAAGVWAVIGPTQFLGAFATYDAMSLMLMALAAWCVTHASGRQMRWVFAAVGALVLANAAKYASALFDPVVAVMAVLANWPAISGALSERALSERARKDAVTRGAALLGFTVSAVVILVTVGGGYYYAGIGQTTLARAAGDNSALSVLVDSWHWTGVIAAAACAAAVLAFTDRQNGPPRRLLVCVLALSAFLAPLEQAHIHTVTSLDKHVDFGAWFAAVAAGYFASRVVRLRPGRKFSAVAIAVITPLLAWPAASGVRQARDMFSWPSSARFTSALGTFAQSTNGRILIDDTAIPKYYLNVNWERWSTTSSITLPSGHTISVPVGSLGHPALYEQYVRAGYWSLIALNYAAKGTLNEEIITELDRDRDYRRVALVPYGFARYGIWVRIGGGA
jgi:Dolichyl-phosphate-mannose-protein mannosyltransferase